MIKTSWRTTFYGLLTAISVWAVDVPDPSWIPVAGKFLMAVSIFLLGKNARDRGVTSADEGAE